MLKVKVSQFGDVKNQFRIDTSKGSYFQSYNSIIVFRKFTKNGAKIYLDNYYWDYSSTTGRYRNQFLGEDKKETEKKIKSGEYKLVNLN